MGTQGTDSQGPTQNPEKLAQESEQLAHMEQAAQASSDPHQIKECHSTRRPPASHADKVWLAVFGLALLVLIGAQFFVNWQQGFISQEIVPRLRNYLRGAALVVGILFTARLLEVFAIGRVGNAVNRYNLKRILRLVVVLAVAFTIVSVLFANWYQAV